MRGRACCSTGLCSWCRQKQAVGSRNWSLHGQMGEAGSGKPNGAVATSGAPHPSKLWRKHVCRMKQTHTEKQEESVQAPEGKASGPRDQAALCLLALESLDCWYRCSKPSFPEANQLQRSVSKTTGRPGQQPPPQQLLDSQESLDSQGSLLSH